MTRAPAIRLMKNQIYGLTVIIARDTILNADVQYEGFEGICKWLCFPVSVHHINSIFVRLERVLPRLDPSSNKRYQYHYKKKLRLELKWIAAVYIVL